MKIVVENSTGKKCQFGVEPEGDYRRLEKDECKSLTLIGDHELTELRICLTITDEGEPVIGLWDNGRESFEILDFVDDTTT